jgi:hypothetical protein
MATKDILFVSFFDYYFLKVHLHHFSEIRSHKKVTKQWNQGFSYYFFLMIEGSGSGSVRPKNIDPTDSVPDRQHCPGVNVKQKSGRKKIAMWTK